MSARVALCADEFTCTNPNLIGLDGEELGSLEWLEVFCSGAVAREGLRERSAIEEAWVVSCDDVDPINLAAALKDDRPELRVKLVAFDADGSLLSRAHTAQLDGVLDKQTFLRTYRRFKHEVNATEVELQVAQGSSVRISAASQALLVPVVSGSGGAGKSTVAVLAALLAAKAGQRTLLLDCDLQFGDVSDMLGLKAPTTFDEVVERPELAQSLELRDGLAVLAAPPKLEDSETISRHLAELIDVLQPHFDVIFANTGASWTEQQAVLLERCRLALFLVDQRASSIRACKHALELCSRCGIAVGPFQFVLNRCAKGAPLTSIDVSCALQGNAVFELRDGGRDVEDYLGSGYAKDFLDTGNDLVQSLAGVLSKLLPDGQRFLDDSARRAERKKQSRRRQLQFGLGRKDVK